jgi:hypothetical protein
MQRPFEGHILHGRQLLPALLHGRQPLVEDEANKVVNVVIGLLVMLIQFSYISRAMSAGSDTLFGNASFFAPLPDAEVMRLKHAHISARSLCIESLG